MANKNFNEESFLDDIAYLCKTYGIELHLPDVEKHEGEANLDEVIFKRESMTCHIKIKD